MLGTNVQDSRDIILGAGVLYFNGINVGQLKGDVSFTPEAEYKEFSAGVPQANEATPYKDVSASMEASYTAGDA